jgi:hypothetical protein
LPTSSSRDRLGYTTNAIVFFAIVSLSTRSLLLPANVLEDVLSEAAVAHASLERPEERRMVLSRGL